MFDIWFFIVKLLSMRTPKFRSTGIILVFDVPIIIRYVETVHNFSFDFLLDLVILF